jgi:hypothetical protein
MITCNTLGTMGRLGNQMFQYATLYAIAKQNNYDFGVPRSKVNNTNEYSKFYLPEIFNLSAKDSSNTNNQKRFVEKKHDYDPYIFSIEDDTDIWGYFQTEKYFKKYKEEIKKEFSFPKEIKNFCESFKKSFFNKKIVSLHVRRGDYLKIPNIHPPCSLNYYQEAISQFDEDSLFLIFSDDIAWCIENFKGERYLFFQNNHYTSLCMMSLCDGHIIANSSYSWWGAWLGGENLVIAPKNWFGQELNYKNTEDVYCDNWVVM